MKNTHTADGFRNLKDSADHGNVGRDEERGGLLDIIIRTNLKEEAANLQQGPCNNAESEAQQTGLPFP
jgi:hypothetical protein